MYKMKKKKAQHTNYKWL